MPSYEMPLEEMKEYRGSSPCPKDFDTYWSDALAELDAVKPEPVLKPAAFQAAGTECFDLYFKGVRGAKIHAKLLMPQHSAGKSPALLQFHGVKSWDIQERALWWRHLIAGARAVHRRTPEAYWEPPCRDISCGGFPMNLRTC